MEITEVRIKLMEEQGERLQGFCSITLDNCFVIRDLKIIEGSSGPFVAMPSRKLTAHCPGCGCKNHLRAAYCNQCGGRLRDDRVAKDEDGRAKLYADIAHPINPACRELIQERVIRAFREEIERSKLPGYVPSYDDFDEEPELDRTPRKRPAAERPAAGRVAAERPAAEKTKIETAEPEPRPPHKRAPQPVSTAAPAAKRDTFGAGIW